MQKYIVEIDDSGTIFWFNFETGKYHRVNGPAIEYRNGRKEWWIDGKLHRTDGPAVEYSDGHKEWWIDGKRLTEKKFNSRMNSYNDKEVEIDGKKYKLTLCE